MAEIKKCELITRVARRLREVIEAVPVVDVMRVDEEATTGTGRVADIVAEIQTPAGMRRLVVEVKREGLPRTLRAAAQVLRTRLANLPDAYGLIAAPFISDRGRTICREMGMGCLDLAGNVSLAFDQLFIERSGIPNPSPMRRLQRSLFAPRSTRVLRVLLENPVRRWYVRDLAGEAGISLAQTSNVKRLLRDQDLLAEERRAFWLAKPDDLLQEWAKAYTYEANDVHYFYTMLRVSEVEERLAALCEEEGIRYGLAFFSGANRVAPVARYNRAFAYIDKGSEELAETLGFKSVPSGANVVLLRPYDEGLFHGLQEVASLKVVSDVQLYLDLKSYKGRGEESADFLYERRIKPRWVRLANPITRTEQ